MTEAPPPLLMTPGPTKIPERVLRAGSRVLHHRTPEFSNALSETIALLEPLLGTTTADVLPVHATGRAAMEGAVLNFFNAGETLISCCNGKFGEMWARLAQVHGLKVVRISTDWDRNVHPEDVSAAFRANPEARAVTVVHSDTSTGVLNDVASVAAVARAHGALALVDGISSVGGAAFDFDDWDLDFAVVSSQKCLMSSPGLSFAAVGPRAWQAASTAAMHRAYLDFGAIRESLTGPRPETPGTTPVLLTLQVREALRMIHEAGIDAVFARHVSMAEALRSRAAVLGFELQGPEITTRSPTLTALRVPEGIDPQALRATVRARGIEIAVGLGPHRDRHVRVGHMGAIQPHDVTRTMDVLEAALDDAPTADRFDR